MNVPELALHHQRLDQRAGHLRAQIARVEAELAGDPEAERLEREHTSAAAALRAVELRLRDRERDAAARRSRITARERELMSGRIRNPTELMKLSAEVEHLKGALSEEEEAEQVLMEEQEGRDAELARLGRDLAAARERSAAAAPGLRERLEGLRIELEGIEAERAATWELVPADWQEAYRRLQRRVADPVAEAAHGQCQACRVGVTSSGMQLLRRGALVHCENCDRLLVVV
jgi:predicted  nucleic acid-binding Zn-ribbon protein